MKQNQLPRGWSDARVRRIISHYGKQTEDEAVVEDERAFKGKKRTVIEVPAELVPMIRAIIAQFKPARKT